MGARDALTRLFGRPRARPPAPPQEPERPPVALRAGALVARVETVGPRAAPGREARTVYAVTVAPAGSPGMSWATRYGFAGTGHSPEAAARAALDELAAACADPEAWRAAAVAGRTEREAEAILASPDMAGTAAAVVWAAPLLEGARAAGGGWALEAVEAGG